jgi:polygalacturonase
MAPATQPEAELPHFAQPQIPDHTFSLTDFGAVGDGKTMNTTAIAKAIVAVAAAGGGTLNVPAGKFLTAPFVLTDNLNLHLDSGATILFSNDPHDFPLANGGYQACITLKDGHDIAITGTGTIDGQGQLFWQHFRMPRTDSPEDNPWLPKRPKLIMLTRCVRVLVRDVTLQNSPMFHLVPAECREVTIDHVYIHSPVPSPNTDGIDPSGFDIRITNCTIDTGDDCIAVKGGERYDPQQPSCENIVVANCTFLHGHGMSIGSESYGGVRHMLVSNCTFNGTNAGIRLKSPRGRGGLVEDLVYQNLTMKGVKNSILITSYYPKIPVDVASEKPRPVSDGTPHWRNIEITNVTASGGQIAGQIVGLPEMPIENVTLTNVHISAEKPIQIVHARNVQFVDSSVSATKGKPIISDADVKGLN